LSGSATNLVASAGTGFKLDPEAATALIASFDESPQGPGWNYPSI